MNKITAYIKQHKIFVGYWGVVALAAIADMQTLASFLTMLGMPWFLLNCLYPFKRYGFPNRIFALIALVASVTVFVFVLSGGEATSTIAPTKQTTRPKPTPEQIAANVKAAKEEQKRLEKQAKEAPKQEPAPVLTLEPLKESNAQVMAAVICEQAVENSLRSPSTADFPFWDKQTYINGHTVTYKSYVDCQNGFGATIRTHFICKIQYNGGKQSDLNNWTLTKLSFSQ